MSDAVMNVAGPRNTFGLGETTATSEVQASDWQRELLTRRANDIVGVTSVGTSASWWSEPHPQLNGRAPFEVIKSLCITEAAIMIMNAAQFTASASDSIRIF